MDTGRGVERIDATAWAAGEHHELDCLVLASASRNISPRARYEIVAADGHPRQPGATACGASTAPTPTASRTCS
ncbi:MAG: hypothetical protein R2716_04620 [Microthrixaceae bacterium]